MKAKQLAISSLTLALLVSVQYVLSFLPGVELVTVILLCFCYTFGICLGVITATTFSFIRCFLFGFSPSVVLLYLIYYNLFAVLFGTIGKRSTPVWTSLILLSLITASSMYFAIAGVPVSILYQKRISIMLWILFGITAAILCLFVVMLIFYRHISRELICVTTLAAFVTICFTLLDDIISPIIYGWPFEAAIGYFYTSFIAMIPQTICVTISVFLLFSPIIKIYKKMKRNIR